MTDELDFDAAFEALINTPELQVVEARAAAQHPTEYVPVDDKDISVNLRSEQGLVVLNVPVDILQGWIVAYAHVQDHRCVEAGFHLEGLLHIIIKEVYDALKREDRLPPPEDLSHGPEGP